MDFVDIDKTLPGGGNLGGIAQYIYFGLWRDVLTFPSANPGATPSFGDDYKLSTDIVMKTGKRMYSLYTTEDAAKLDIAAIGEEGGKGFQLTLSVYSPGLSSKLMGFINGVKNEDLVLIAPDNNGQMYILGDALRSAKFSASEGSGTGTTTEGRRGIGLTFSFTSPHLYEYTGSVPLTEAVAP